jgi:hypothetical protein
MEKSEQGERVGLYQSNLAWAIVKVVGESQVLRDKNSLWGGGGVRTMADPRMASIVSELYDWGRTKVRET